MTPNVLVISNNCFSESDSNGRTLGNLFTGFPKESLSQFYIQSSEPDFNICDRYFRCTDTMALKSLLGKKFNGVVMPNNTHKSAQTVKTARKRKRNALSMLARDFIWRLGSFKNEYFKKWISENAPDIVVLQAGDCPFMFDLAVSISKKYKAQEKELYYSLMHTLFSVSQKLSLSGKMLKMDEANDEIQQLKLLGKIFLGGLK